MLIYKYTLILSIYIYRPDQLKAILTLLFKKKMSRDGPLWGLFTYAKGGSKHRFTRELEASLFFNLVFACTPTLRGLSGSELAT